MRHWLTIILLAASIPLAAQHHRSDALDDVLQHVSEYRLDIVQLHGHEDREYIRELRQPDGDLFSVMKAISVSDDSDIATYKQYEDSVDYFLFDTKCKTVGGSGQQFDWSVLSGYDGSRPFLLSGGIGPDSCERLRAFHHPRLAGIDLNSRFEVSPALKDISQLKQFLYEQNQSTLCRTTSEWAQASLDILLCRMSYN